MRLTSVSAAALVLTVISSCGGGDNALRDATADDLPRLVLQQEDVPDGSPQGTESCGQAAAEELGGATKSYSAAYDLSSLKAQQISCLGSTVGLYRSGDEALAYLRGLDAAYFEGDRPAQATPDLVAEKIDVPKLGEYASGFVIKSTCPQGVECQEPDFRIYNIQIQQRNVRSLITVSGGPDERVVEGAIEYAEKQKERVETVLRQAQ